MAKKIPDSIGGNDDSVQALKQKGIITDEQKKELVEMMSSDELTKKLTEKKESKETPLKKLEQERKTAAIAELDRLGKKTDENVEKINAIQFLDDNILIGNTPWAYENMQGGQGVFKQATNRHYYNFAERTAEANKQSIVLPEKKDFENTLHALPGQESASDGYQGYGILFIILGESRLGYCNSGGMLYSNGGYGYLGSVSEYDEDRARSFRSDGGEGILCRDSKYFRFVCRPLVKNS